MSHRGHLDSLRFAREGRCQAGRLGLDQMPRLADQVLRMEAPLAYSLAGMREDEKSFLVLEVSGEVWLRCQRCLGELPYRLQLATRFLLVAEGEEWPEEELTEDRYDALPADAHMDVAALVEDEVMLALPIAPRHADCETPAHAGEDSQRSPFGVLRDIKRH